MEKPTMDWGWNRDDTEVKAAQALVADVDEGQRLKHLAARAIRGAHEIGTPPGEWLAAAELVYLATFNLPAEYLLGAHLAIRREALNHMASFGQVDWGLDEFMRVLQRFIGRRWPEFFFQEGAWHQWVGKDKQVLVHGEAELLSLVTIPDSIREGAELAP